MNPFKPFKYTILCWNTYYNRTEVAVERNDKRSAHVAFNQIVRGERKPPTDGAWQYPTLYERIRN